MDTLTIKTALGKIIDPARNKPLSELKAIRKIGINPETNVVELVIELAQRDSTVEKNLRRAIAKVIKLDLQMAGVKITFTEVTHLTADHAQTILIMGAKGGVGNSHFTVELAQALTAQGHKVGILDADFQNPSIPLLLKAEPSDPFFSDQKMIPYLENHIEFMSVAFFINQEDAVVWHPSMEQSMLTNFFYQVEWNHDLDFLLIDFPSRLDELIKIATKALTSKRVIITTEDNDLAHYHLRKKLIAMRDLGLDVRAIYSKKQFKLDNYFITNSLDEVIHKLH